MKPRLVAITGPVTGEVFDLGEEPFAIGRHSSNQLQIRESSVSRCHCELRREGERSVLRDLDSRHGTFVNGVPVRRRRLEDGDFLRIGESLFRFLVGEGERLPEVPPLRLAEGEFTAGSTVQLPLETGPEVVPKNLLAALGSGTRARRHLDALVELAAGLHRLRRVEPLARRLVEWALATIPAERAALFLIDPWDGEIVPAWSVDGGAGEPAAVSRALVRRVLEQGAAELSTDVDPPAGLDAGGSAGAVGCLICAPLNAGSRALGVLYLERPQGEDRFEEDHLRLASAAAAVAAAALENARHLESLAAENRRLRSAELEHDMVGESPAMDAMLRFVARVAATDSTVLLRGESGTGKELVARAIHRNSQRSEKPFVAINCATLSETLLESELFGHERGAFTGAVARRAGKLEVADGGTVFFDEVGEIPVALQAKLLRALETRCFERVGGSRPVEVDVRWVAATNRDLEAAIAGGTFRQDLYYRLNVLTVELPPLRQRREDVPLLARHFTDRFARKLNRRVAGLAPAVRDALLAYDWPGNVRELANAIERALVLGDGEELRPEDLPEAVIESAGGAPTRFHEAVAEAKRRLILDAIGAAAGNLSHAAEQLGLNPTYLHRLITNLGLRDQLER